MPAFEDIDTVIHLYAENQDVNSWEGNLQINIKGVRYLLGNTRLYKPRVENVFRLLTRVFFAQSHNGIK